MFRTEAMRVAVCRKLLASLGLERFMNDHGFTTAGWDLVESDGGYLSSGERVMLLFAAAVWNDHKALPASALFDLDYRRLALVGSLLVALADGTHSEALDDWLNHA